MNYAILGASDPEMSAIETLLRKCGVWVLHAAVSGTRAHPSNAYRADGLLDGTREVVLIRRMDQQPVHVLAVECDGPAVHRCLACGTTDVESTDDFCGDAHEWARVMRADHHHPGDPGFGRPPSEFMSASSLGQVISWLARQGILHLAKFTSFRVSNTGGATGQIVCGPDGMWWVHVGRSEIGDIQEPIPHDLVLTAAADHCLGAAYRGECPGADPDELLAWRVRERAKFQGRDESEVRADIEAARTEIQLAREVVLLRTPGNHCGDGHCGCREGGYGYGGSTGTGTGDCYCDCDGCADGDHVVTARDMRRDTPVKELVEAATRDGVSYISGPLIGPDGRRKFTCNGMQEVIEAWMSHWAPAHGLVDIYGDPARGFAGGYEG